VVFIAVSLERSQIKAADGLLGEAGLRGTAAWFMGEECHSWPMTVEEVAALTPLTYGGRNKRTVKPLTQPFQLHHPPQLKIERKQNAAHRTTYAALSRRAFNYLLLGKIRYYWSKHPSYEFLLGIIKR
jgi:hypothetical protein